MVLLCSLSNEESLIWILFLNVFVKNTKKNEESLIPRQVNNFISIKSKQIILSKKFKK